MDFFLFGVLPYIALSVLVIGSIARYERDPFTWKSSSSQLLRRRQLILGSVLFHVGVLVVFFGHLIGLLTPVEVFHVLGIGFGAKQVMAIGIGGLAGALVGRGAAGSGVLAGAALRQARAASSSARPRPRRVKCLRLRIVQPYSFERSDGQAYLRITGR